nr:acyltransferase domain-containing protein [Tessaracoccus massiliensis]
MSRTHRITPGAGTWCGWGCTVGRWRATSRRWHARLTRRWRASRWASRSMPMKRFARPGLITVLALVAVAEDVHAEMVRRGVPDDVAWASLADLGQQAHIFRQVFGCFGLLARGWCASNYTGRLLWLGRLQYTLERDDEGTFLGVHIPESGPLTPEAVDESLAWARELAPRVFPEYAVDRFMIQSWLLDPGVAGLLNPESNFVRFAERFELTGDSEDGWRDALFYGFRHEPALQPVDLSALPADSSLRRALLQQIDGAGVRVLGGRLRPECGAHR